MEFDFSEMAGKSVLISGGCGFLGSNLARKCLELGAKVSIFILPGEDRSRIGDIGEQLKIFEGDLRVEEDVAKAIEGIDYFFHFAWQTDLKQSMIHPLEDFKADGVGIINILESCRKHNPEIKIIFTSTVTVVGNISDIPADEMVLPNPGSVYDIHKLLGEHYLKMYHEAHGLNTVVLRLSNVFGEGQKIDNPNRGVLNFMIGRALRGEALTVYGEGDFIRDYCYVGNYIDAFILAAISDKTSGELFVLGTGKGLTFQEVVDKIKSVAEGLGGKKVEIAHVPFPGGDHKINRRDFIANFDKFNEATGWEPRVGFDEGLKNTVKFYLEKIGGNS